MEKSFMCMWIFLFLMSLMLILKVLTGMELLFNILWILTLIGWFISTLFAIKDLMK